MRPDDEDDEQTIEPGDIKWPDTPGPVARYKSPPAASRFQPGKSGNPKGRPKKSKETKADILKKVLLEEHQVTIDGQRVSRTAIALVFLALQKKAMDGHSQAAAEFEKLNDRYGPQEPQGRVARRAGPADAGGLGGDILAEGSDQAG